MVPYEKQNKDCSFKQRKLRKSFRKKSSWRIFFEKYLVISSDSSQIVGESKGKGLSKSKKGEWHK